MESSNAKKEEFNLFRSSEEELKNWNPDPFMIMNQKLYRNLKRLREFKMKLEKLNISPKIKIYSFNCGGDTQQGYKGRLDPYSCNVTALRRFPYNSYIRSVFTLSPEWFSLGDGNFDRRLMGRTKLKSIPEFPSSSLNDAIAIIASRNEKRALEVASFYNDLQSSIKNVSKIIKPSGYSCYVVVKPTVSFVILPTSDAIKDFFEYYGFSHVKTYVREDTKQEDACEEQPYKCGR